MNRSWLESKMNESWLVRCFVVAALSCLFLGILLFALQDVHGSGYGSSFEGDSTVVTYVHHVEVDSAHCRFAFGEAVPYDSAFLYPVAGVTNKMLIADDKLDLDSAGAHVVSIIVYDDDVVIDTTYGLWLHDVVTPVLIDTLRYLSDMSEALAAYFGTCDECYQILYPRDGTANKDSVIIVDPSRGADSLRGKIIWHHDNVAGVYDSSYFYFDEPW